MAFIYEADRCKPLKLTVCQDTDSEVYYSFTYRPDQWQATKEYKQAPDEDSLGDIVIPTTVTGFHYECTSTGVSDSTEPTTWASVEDATTTDGTVTWTAKTNDTLLFDGDTISASTWAIDPDTITLSNDAIETGITVVKVSGIPTGTTKFTLTNTITVTRQSSKVEKFDRSIIVKVKDK